MSDGQGQTWPGSSLDSISCRPNTALTCERAPAKHRALVSFNALLARPFEHGGSSAEAWTCDWAVALRQ